MITELIVLEEENKNIVIIALIIGIITGFTKFKELTSKEKKDQRIIRIIIIIALATFITTRRIIFVTLIEITMIPLVYLVMNYAKGKDKIKSIKYFIVINSFGSIPFIIYSLKKISLINDREIEDFFYSYNERNLTAIAFLILLMVKTPIITLHL